MQITFYMKNCLNFIFLSSDLIESWKYVWVRNKISSLTFIREVVWLIEIHLVAPVCALFSVFTAGVIVGLDTVGSTVCPVVNIILQDCIRDVTNRVLKIKFILIDCCYPPTLLANANLKLKKNCLWWIKRISWISCLLGSTHESNEKEDDWNTLHVDETKAAPEILVQTNNISLLVYDV